MINKLTLGVSLSTALLVLAAPASAADKSRNSTEGPTARDLAAKNCEIYLRDGREALADRRLPEAERWLNQARAEAEKIGPESPEMARAMQYLGALLLTRKKYVEAEAFLARSLTVAEKAFGPDDPAVGPMLHDLAAARVALRKYAEAEPIALRALAIAEKAPGARKEDLARDLEILALIYAFQDRVPRAEETFRRAVEVREEVQGADHPDLATALMDMARAREMGALRMHLEATRKWLVKPGDKLPDGYLDEPDDPSEASYRAAEALMERALAIREKALGPEHPDTIDVIDRLVNCFEMHVDHAHADPLLRRLLALREKAFGPDDPAVAETLDALADRATERGEYREAESLLRRALAIAEKARRAKPDDEKAGEAEGEYARALRRAVRSAEVMEDPARRPTEDDLKYLNGLDNAVKEPDLVSLFNSQDIDVNDEWIGDAGLVHLRKLVNVESLEIDAEWVSDEGLVHLERLTNLKKLDLSGSKIRGPGLARLGRMTDLEELDLGVSSLLDDDGLAYLPPLLHLKKLDLVYTPISDAGLVHLKRLTALEVLNVDGTRVTGKGIEDLKRSRPGLKLAHLRPLPPDFPPPPFQKSR